MKQSQQVRPGGHMATGLTLRHTRICVPVMRLHVRSDGLHVRSDTNLYTGTLLIYGNPGGGCHLLRESSACSARFSAYLNTYAFA
jgi:hypothetical protein